MEKGGRRNYEEGEVVRQLGKKADIRITGNQIQQLRDGKGDVGNKSKGKIDFLVKYCGYIHFFVARF